MKKPAKTKKVKPAVVVAVAVDLQSVMTNMYRGIMPDVSALSEMDKKDIRALLDNDSRNEMVLTEREKMRRILLDLLK